MVIPDLCSLTYPPGYPDGALSSAHCGLYSWQRAWARGLITGTYPNLKRPGSQSVRRSKQLQKPCKGGCHCLMHTFAAHHGHTAPLWGHIYEHCMMLDYMGVLECALQLAACSLAAGWSLWHAGGAVSTQVDGGVGRSLTGMSSDSCFVSS